MKSKATWLALIPVLLCSSIVAAKPQQAAILSFNDVVLDNVSKIRVGTMNEAQVKEILGAPYRMTNYGDCNPIDYQKFWDYVGHDANGHLFLIHIEFDDDGIARIIAKDPKNGPIVVLAAAPKPEKHHMH